MDSFEINNLLRLLRSSVHQQRTTATKNPNPAAASANFVTSGQRFETLKSLHRHLKRQQSCHLSLATVQSILDVLRSILAELTGNYFDSPSAGTVSRSNSITATTAAASNARSLPVKKSISVDNVFVGAVRRNEILEILQTVIDLVTKIHTNADTNNNTTVNRDGDSYPPFGEDFYVGRIFLPEVITLLGK